MIVVIDTNALVPMLGTTHPFHKILRMWMRGEFTLALTTEILLEYEEIAKPRIGDRRWHEFPVLLDRVAALRNNLLRVSPTFRFRLIAADPDDDKFADCAIAAEANYIITSDHHFDALTGSGYKPQPIAPEDFIRRCLAGA